MSDRIVVVAAIIKRGVQVLLAKRPSDKHQGGKWEFPGGKVERGESLENALVRECKEEINLSLVDVTHFKSIAFDYPDKKIALHFFISNQFTGEAKGLEGQELAWVDINDLHRLELPDANKIVVERLKVDSHSLDRIPD